MAKKQKQHPVNYDKQKREQQQKAKAEIAKQSELQNCVEGSVNLQFTPIDTWFFRESRPHDAVGASELSSLFPPPIRTLMGAVRRFLGDSMGVDWKNFNNPKEYKELKQQMGDSQSLGQLLVNGAWVCKDGQRLYPAPCYLMQKGDEFARLQIGKVVECDLGKVRLPELPEGKAGYKGLEQTWLTTKGWQKLLKGEEPIKKDLIKAADLFCNEARLGIARNNQTRSVIEGRLYQTQHLRLESDVTIQLDVNGLARELVAKLPEKGREILRLGGEGRMAGLEKKSDYLPLPSLVTDKKTLEKIIIHFITAADFNGEMFPEHFTKQTLNNQTEWKGKINGITLIIDAAVIGKVHREGGWNMQKHQPRAVKSYIPAGSAWFCRLETAIPKEELISALHGRCIGEDTAWGRGQILIGLWNDIKGK